MNTSRWPRLMKWLKRLAFALPALITLIVLVLAVEGWRAKRAWEAYKQQLAARGDNLDWASHTLPPVPDDQNFLATPALAACFGFAANQTGAAAGAGGSNACDELIRRFDWVAALPGDDWRAGTVVSLAEWQAKLRATNDPAVLRQLATRYGLTEEPAATNAASPAASHPARSALLARPPGKPVEDLRFMLNHDRKLLDELRVAARRPFAQLRTPPELFSDAMLPWLTTLKGLAHLFRVACRTELEAGNPEAAAEDFASLLALADAAGSLPLLLCALGKVELLELAVQPLWAGLMEHRWTEPALARIEARLAHLNVVADFKRSLHGERAFNLAILGIASDPDHDSPAPEIPYRTLVRYWPRAFVYYNQLNLARGYQAVLLDRLNPAGPEVRLTPSPADAAWRRAFGSRSPYNFFATLLLPAVERSVQRAAASQATITLARVACALERHRLATGAYPERLAELAPRFLTRVPPDPVNGGMLKYRCEAPDRFVLYSVGLDAKDDSGTALTKIRLANSGEAPSGDWVWRSWPVAVRE